MQVNSITESCCETDIDNDVHDMIYVPKKIQKDSEGFDNEINDDDDDEGAENLNHLFQLYKPSAVL